MKANIQTHVNTVQILYVEYYWKQTPYLLISSWREKTYKDNNQSIFVNNIIHFSSVFTYKQNKNGIFCYKQSIAYYWIHWRTPATTAIPTLLRRVVQTRCLHSLQAPVLIVLESAVCVRVARCQFAIASCAHNGSIFKLPLTITVGWVVNRGFWRYERKNNNRPSSFTKLILVFIRVSRNILYFVTTVWSFDEFYKAKITTPQIKIL